MPFFSARRAPVQDNGPTRGTSKRRPHMSKNMSVESIGDITIDTAMSEEDDQPRNFGWNDSDTQLIAPVEKTVRFRTNRATGELDNQVIVFDNSMNKKYKKDLFYTSAEFGAGLEIVQRFTDRVRRECTDIPLLLKHLNEKSHLHERGLEEIDTSLLMAWSDSEARGLEEFIRPNSHRRLSSKRVIKFQSIMKSTGNEDIQRALAHKAAMESQEAKSFAIAIAMGDEMVVKSKPQRRRSSQSKVSRRRSSTRSTRVAV